MTSLPRKLGKRRKAHAHAFAILQETERWDGSPVVIRVCDECGALERVIYGPSTHV